MKASLNWLRELLPALEGKSADEVGKLLTGAGLEVEGLSEYGKGVEGCVVAEVVSLRPHPKKSGLRLVTVDFGEGHQEIVCGAPNVPDPGGLVILAKLGAYLPAKDLTIAPREIAGVSSSGMLCSESELGLSEEGEGILILPPGVAPKGTPLAQAVPAMRDAVLEIGLTPNRPDGLGHVGLARELAAVLGVPFATPKSPAFGAEDVPFDVPIEILAADRCHEFSAAILRGVSIAPSPLAWRYRLLALGVRPISNVVDVTNLVLLGWGQPMHAFDLAKVRGRRITVRLAQENEPFTTLDGVARKLSSDDLVVCDGEGPVALAGVMGGENSEISATTNDVLFECAYFDARGVRRASRRHGLHTEASHRFERGTDPSALEGALAYAVSLTQEVSAGVVVSEPRYVREKVAHAAPLGKTRASAKLRASFMDRVLGIVIPFADARAVLERLGCETTESAPGELTVLLPTHRPDLTREIDLVEEVVRVHGIDRVPAVLPAVRGSREVGEREALERRVRTEASKLGLSEAITFRFTSPRALAAVHAPEPTVVLENPINDHQTVMRTSLLPGLFEAVVHARRHGVRSSAPFVVGPRFLPGREPGGLPEERVSFAAVLAGDRPGWLTKPEPVDVWDAKGVVEGLVTALTGEAPTLDAFPADERPLHLHPRAAGRVVANGLLVGAFGLPHPDVVDAFELGENVALIELDLAALLALPKKVTYRAIPRFPASPRDLAVVVHDDVSAGSVRSAILEAASPLGREVELFDRFVGASIPKDHSSLAFRVVYRADDRTLTDAEVDKSHAAVVSLVEQKFGATLRK
jgi:phenylalanyl-tRNA synthetase beta chain